MISSENMHRDSIIHSEHAKFRNELTYTYCLSQCCKAVKRHHNDKSYKGTCKWDLYFQRFSLSSACQEAWWHTVRHGNGKGAEFYISASESSRKKETLIPTLAFETLEHTSWHFLKQPNTYSKKAIPFNLFKQRHSPWIQINEHMEAILFQTTTDMNVYML